MKKPRQGLFALSDRELSELIRSADEESARRTRAAVAGADTLAALTGNELGKRALLVAAAGGHTLLAIGPPNSGKTMLRAAAAELGLLRTYEARPCLCGYRNDPRRDCKCTAAQIGRTMAKWPAAEVNVEMMIPTERQRSSRLPGTTLEQLKRQLADLPPPLPESARFDLPAENLLKAAVGEIPLDPVEESQARAIGRTIARLDHSDHITAAHICEAINYRALGRF